jgi:multidrug efflux pump subunit AcrA (membrane-fusion protein)
MIYDVFLSYSPGSQKIAEALTVWLEQEGFSCFVAFRDIPAGEQWVNVVPESIKNSRVFVPISAPDTRNAAPVYEEISVAIENARPIFPFKLRAFTPETGHAENWTELPWMNAFPLPQKTFGKITRQLKKLLLKNFPDNVPFPIPPGPPSPSRPKGPLAWFVQGLVTLLFLALLFSLVPLSRSGHLASWRQDWKDFLSEGFTESMVNTVPAPPKAPTPPATPQYNPNVPPPSLPRPPAPLPAPPPARLSVPAQLPPPVPPPRPESFHALGILKSFTETPVFAEIQGQVIEVYVSEGDMVEKGKPLAKTENLRLNQQIEETRLALAKARERLPEAERALAEAKTIVERNTKRREETGGLSPSKLEWDSGNIGLERALAGLAAAKASADEVSLKLGILETDKAKTILRSPADGIVLKRNCTPGQIIGESFIPQNFFLIASSLERLKLHCNVSEKAITRVVIGGQITFQTIDFPGRNFTAKVLKIGNVPVATNTPALSVPDGKTPVLYSVELLVENPGNLLRPGMTVSTEF